MSYSIFVNIVSDSYISNDKIEKMLSNFGLEAEEYDKYGCNSLIVGSYTSRVCACKIKEKIERTNLSVYIKKLIVPKLCVKLLECIEDATCISELKIQLKRELLTQNKKSKSLQEKSFVSSINKLYAELETDFQTKSLEEVKASLISNFGLYLCQNFE